MQSDILNIRTDIAQIRKTLKLVEEQTRQLNRLDSELTFLLRLAESGKVLLEKLLSELQKDNEVEK